jgi:hypothetical protein
MPHISPTRLGTAERPQNKKGGVFQARLVDMTQSHPTGYSPFLSADNQLPLMSYANRNISLSQGL